ncbi:hydrolase [Cellulomonas sp. IC4_254]|uniref:hydrolase n=1 Tax=Cellulomonas sp. IC4_254 TaxID=2714040 RepID=UPI00196B6535
MSRTDTLLLLDFDGTVAVGHGPVHAYARAAASSLAPDARRAFLAETTAAVERLGEPDPAGRAARASADGLLPLDGYDLVRVLAEQHGVGPLALSAAYLASRHALGTDDAPVSAPPGLAAVLAEVRTEATVVLATNAPAIRLPETLATLGLTGLLDAVLTEVGKPAGMAAVLDRFGVAPAGRVRALSVGDVWANDLAPVAARGHATALVSRRPPPEARPTWTVPDLPALYPALREWVRADGRTAPSQHQPQPARVPARVTTEG